MMKKYRLKPNISKKIYVLVIVVLLGIFIISFKNIIVWYIDNQKIKREDEKIKSIVDIDERVIVMEEPTEEELKNNPDLEAQYWRYKDVSLIDVDIDKLKKENSATVGWIQVSGTNINYPIVQAQDNEYFLYHDFEGNWNIGGWIFADYRINLNDLSSNNIIYGHRRLNNSMFGTLKNVFTDEWLNNPDNYIIKVSTDKYYYLFEVFSIYNIENESYYIQADFNNLDSYQKFLDTIIDRSEHNFDLNVSTSDKILTLSTCHLTDANKRVVVHSKLVRKVEKN